MTKTASGHFYSRGSWPLYFSLLVSLAIWVLLVWYAAGSEPFQDVRMSMAVTSEERELCSTLRAKLRAGHAVE